MTTAACSPIAEADARTADDPVALGHEFAVTRCASCHAVELTGLSPNPQSPRFEAVVNRPGVTQETLVPWLDNSHNFPQDMNFEIAPEDIDHLAAYMMTLQHADFRPIPQ
ncbi:cytochrome c [Croceicoccus sp. Ery15]|uniref:cytochrome c n=1 Tax=Croceicoccus sp. Ery15 TaxID=1703338 RepID=UPI001E4C13F4|nr:cytochrome c [Croceicoccus sp. Ery15]